MKNVLDHDRFLFIFTLPLGASMLWVSNLASLLFWAGVVSWALLFFLAGRLKKRILNADTWAQAIEAGTFTRKVATRFYLLLIPVLFSPLLPMFLATRVIGLEPMLFSGLVGGMVGLDSSIGYSWLRRHRK